MNGIKAARLKAKMKQEEVAQSMNVSQGAISLWERGECFPAAAKLVPLAMLLNCTVDELLEDRS